MTTTSDRTPDHDGVATAVPRFYPAGRFLDGLAAQDFAQLGDTLSPDVHFRALLPSGPKEWRGATTIAKVFAGWFGDTECFELVEATAGEIGDRLHLHWRLRLKARRLGAGWFIVEQQAYANTDDTERIGRLDLLCTGYRRDGDDG